MLIVREDEVRKFITGFVPFKFKDGAYELTAGSVFAQESAPRVIDYKQDQKLAFSQIFPDFEGMFEMRPRKHFLVRARERLSLPKDVYATGYSLKGLSQSGVELVGNPLFHLGYNGVPELTLCNINEISYYNLYRDQPIIQLQFFRTSEGDKHE